MATFVLVPGGWSGGWQWTDIARRLRHAGHEVFTPTLTGLGERVHLATRDVGLETHIRDIVNLFVYEDLDQVILLGYSYSGVVVTGVAERIPERIARLAYLDALLPGNGKALIDLLEPQAAQGMRRLADAAGDSWLVPHNPPDAPHRTPHPLKTFTDPLTLGNPAAAQIPRTFIQCMQSPAQMGAASAPIQACAMQARAAGWQFFELDSGHVPMETAPEALTAILLELGAAEDAKP